MIFIIEKIDGELIEMVVHSGESAYPSTYTDLELIRGTYGRYIAEQVQRYGTIAFDKDYTFNDGGMVSYIRIASYEVPYLDYEEWSDVWENKNG